MLVYTSVVHFVLSHTRMLQHAIKYASTCMHCYPVYTVCTAAGTRKRLFSSILQDRFCSMVHFVLAKTQMLQCAIKPSMCCVHGCKDYMAALPVSSCKAAFAAQCQVL